MAKKSTVKNKNSEVRTEVKTKTPTPSTKKLSPFMRILLSLIVIVGVFLLLLFSQPNQFSVEQDITIAAPASQIFSLVNNLHHWSAWFPWEKEDPEIKWTFVDPVSGVGAVDYWSGNSAVGQGKMVITESTKNSHVAVQINFVQPTVKLYALYFDLFPTGNETVVKWRILGDNNLADKFDDLLGRGRKTLDDQMQVGLEQLKALVESPNEKPKDKKDSTQNS